MTRTGTRSVPGGERLYQRIYTRLGCQGRPPHFSVEFHPYTDLTHTIRLRDGMASVRLSDVLRSASRKVLDAAAAILIGRLYRRRVPTDLLEIYREFSYARGTRRRLLKLRRKRARHLDHRPQGKHHDLKLIFTQLNRCYFHSKLKRPRLGWSARTWRTQLGCFDPALDQILLNRLLDRKEVPTYVVAYVLYHEMLHLKYPMRFARCRRESHSVEFRRGEKRFAHYTRAIKFLEGASAY